MSERVKKTSRKEIDPTLLPDVPFELVVSKQGGYECRFKGTPREHVEYYIRKYNLDPEDLYVKDDKVVLKKTGRYKIALQKGFAGSKIVSKEFDVKLGYAYVTVQVFKEGIEKPFEDMGFCARDENSLRKSCPFGHIILTAATRAIIRATMQIAPLSINYEELEGDISEVEQAKVQQVLEKPQKCKACGMTSVFKEKDGKLFCPECFEEELS